MPGGGGCCFWWKKGGTPAPAAPVNPPPQHVKTQGPALETEESKLVPPVAAAPEDAGASAPEPAVRISALAAASEENPPAESQPASGNGHKVAVVEVSMARNDEEGDGDKRKHNLRLGVSRGLGIHLDAVGVGAVLAGSLPQYPSTTDVIILSVEKDGAVVDAHACAQRLVNALQDKTSEMHQVLSSPSQEPYYPARLAHRSALSTRRLTLMVSAPAS